MFAHLELGNKLPFAPSHCQPKTPAGYPYFGLSSSSTPSRRWQCHAPFRWELDRWDSRSRGPRQRKSAKAHLRSVQCAPNKNLKDPRKKSSPAVDHLGGRSDLGDSPSKWCVGEKQSRDGVKRSPTERSTAHIIHVGSDTVISIHPSLAKLGGEITFQIGPHNVVSTSNAETGCRRCLHPSARSTRNDFSR